MTTFLHTADWQLGKPFARLADSEKRARLRQGRLDVLKKIATAAAENKAAFILVAGDLFDSQTPEKSTVSAACAAIGKMDVPVVVIPGNHDFGGPGSIWTQKFFLAEKEALAPNLHVLLEPEPFLLPEAVILPAPLLQRHTLADSTQWIRSVFETGKLPSDLPRIVLAHGTVQGFGPSGDEDEDDSATTPNLIDLARLPDPEIDYMALGDWHGTKKVGGKGWYAGTPEPDRFPRGDSNEPGNILKVTTSRGAAPVIEILPTAGFEWHETAFHFTEDSSLPAFQKEIEALVGNHGSEKLLLLTLTGSLGLTAAAELEVTLEALESRLLRLKLRNKTSIAPTVDEIQALASRPADPLISQVAAGLLELAESPGEREVALLALRHLHGAVE